jgi:hypothetical protein
MPRLGELLVAARLLTAEQIEQALRAQVMWGGRLGTALVELGFIDLDTLTRALGRQHGMPAALARHFEKADPELQAKLPAALAERLSVVPLLRLAAGNIAVAAMDRLTKVACAQIAGALDCELAELVVSIAPEQRVMYQLERVYGIQRDARFLRVPGPSATPFPELGEVPIPIDSDPEVSVPVHAVVPAAPALVSEAERDAVPVPIDVSEFDVQAPAEDLAALIDKAVDSVADRPGEPPASRDRRSYVRTVSDEEPPPTATALGRIAIRRVKFTANSMTVLAETDESPKTLADALRAVKRSPQRDRVAELAIDALMRFAPACEAAMLMVVRGHATIGWRWFCRTGDPPANLAVPTAEAGLVAATIAGNTVHRAPVTELVAVDAKLASALGATTGELVVVPIPIAGQVMCLVAAVMHAGGSIDPLTAVAGAASTAFARLIRDASR